MNKTKFILTLTEKLNGFPPEEWEDCINFYLESIDDRMEEGLSEEEAIAALGSIDDIVTEILENIPLTRLVVKKIKPRRRLAAWEIVLICLGSPIWLSLLAALWAVIISVYASLWAVIISLWAAEGSFIASSLGGIGAGIAHLALGNVAEGLFLLGAGVLLVGLSILFFYGCKLATKGIVLATKKLAIGIKKLFIRKEKTT